MVKVYIAGPIPEAGLKALEQAGLKLKCMMVKELLIKRH